LLPIGICNQNSAGVVLPLRSGSGRLCASVKFAEGHQIGSDTKSPSQAYNEHPRPTDHRNGNSGEIKPSKDAKAQCLNPKRAGQHEAALPLIEFAG
jgi:hypothetical protein